MASTSKVEAKDKAHDFQKGTSTYTPPKECVCVIWKQCSKRFPRYGPETELKVHYGLKIESEILGQRSQLIIRHQLKSIITTKSKLKNQVKVITQKGTSTPPKGCVHAILKPEWQWHRSSFSISASWLQFKISEIHEEFIVQSRALSNKPNRIEIG